MKKRSLFKKIQVIALLLILPIVLAGCIDFDFFGSIAGEKQYDQATSIVISPVSTSKILVGDELVLSAKVYPETARNVVNWSSSNEEVATVDNSGVVTAKRSGSTTITASTPTGGISQYFHLTVVDALINIDDIEIIGDDVVFVDDILSLNFQTIPATPHLKVEWESSNEIVATIDKYGRVRGLVPGEVIITVNSANSIVDTKAITVRERTGVPKSISLVGLNILELGSSISLKVETQPIGALNSVSYASSDEDIAVVNENGIVNGLKPGKVIITASYDNNPLIKDEFEVDVVNYNIDQADYLNLYKNVIKNTKDSILGVANYKYDTNGNLKSSSIGSGVVYKVWFTLNDGTVIDDIKDLHDFKNVKTYHYYMLTNKHVVLGADEVKVYLHQEEEEIAAQVIKYDSKIDIAVVSFVDDKYYRPLEFADISNLNAGEIVVAIGNPEGFQYSSSATRGIVSHPKRYLPDDTDDDGVNDWEAEYIQHDAAINPGNSGGPLLNTNGEIIGINTLKLAATEIDNMGFSIPINVIQNILPYLENGEVPVRALLGVNSYTVKDVLKNPDDQGPIIPEGVTYGLYVSSLADGVALNSGVKVGDVILEFNGVKINKSLDLRLELGKIIIGNNERITIRVYRDGNLMDITLIFD
jgi:serine protease Do